MCSLRVHQAPVLREVLFRQAELRDEFGLEKVVLSLLGQQGRPGRGHGWVLFDLLAFGLVLVGHLGLRRRLGDGLVLRRASRSVINAPNLLRGE